MAIISFTSSLPVVFPSCTIDFDRCKAHGHYYFVALDNVLLIYKEIFRFGDDFQNGGSITRYVLLKMSLKNGRQSVQACVNIIFAS